MKVIKNIYRLIIVLVLSTAVSFSQNMLVHKYTEEDGMPGSSVFSIMQDSNAYMYFATRGGIVKYNGLKMQVINSGIDSDFYDYSTFYKDKQENLYLFVPGSSFAFYKLTGNTWQKVIHCPDSMMPKHRHNNYPYAISNKNNSLQALIFILNRGLFHFENDQWKKIPLENSNIIHHIVHYDNTFFIASSNGLMILSDNGKLEKVGNGVPSKVIYSLSLEKKNNGKAVLWLLGKDFLGYYDFSVYNDFITSKEFDFYYPNERINIVPNYYNSLVIGTRHNIIQVHKNNKRINKISTNNGLIDNSTNSIFIDREQNLWFGSSRGISKIPSMRFINYNKYHGLLEDEVTSIVELNNRHYIGHNFGISIAKGQNDIKHLVFDEITPNTRVMDMTISPLGEVYVAADGNGLFKITKNDQLVKIPLPEKYNSITSAIFDKNGTFYIVANSSILSKSLTDRNFKEIYSTDYHIRKLFVDNNNELWATTLGNGVVHFKNGQVIEYKSNSMQLNNCFSLNFDYKDTVLVGTISGLAYINDNSIQKYPFIEIEKPIYFIQKHFDAYWFGTDAGIFRWDKISLRQYAVKEGLAGLETNRDACFVDRHNFMWIGTNRGLSRYSKEYDNLNIIKPICYIKSLTINHDKFRNTGEQFKIPGNHRNIYIGVEILSFIDESRNQIQYKMEGFDTEWSKIQSHSNTDLLYRKLPPGKYKLKVRVSNSLGVWSDIIESPTIIVEKPYYLTSWFLILVLLGIILIGYLIIKFISENKYKSKLEEQVALRTSQLAESELRYKQMFADNNAYMLIIDIATGKILDANPSALNYYGIGRENLNNITIFDLIAEFIEDRQDFLEHIKAQKAFQCKHKTAADTSRDVVVHQSIININNLPVLYAIIEDITERKIAEEKLRALNAELEDIVLKRTKDLEITLEELKTEVQIRKKTEEELFEANEKLFLSLEREKELGELKSRFISMISHEYRTPLTVILSSAYLVKESLKRGLNDEIDRHLYKIHASVTAMSRLLEDVLTYGKAEEGALAVKASEFNLNSFINEIIEEATSSDQSEHSYKVISSDEIIVITDRYLLRQILLNLLINSAKFSDKGTKITIEMKLFKNDFSIIITDEGKGISDQDLSQIFNPFYRNEKTIGIIPGTGLGLAIVKRCVDLLSGSIKVNNKLAKGVSFTITLPIKHTQK